MELDVAVRTNSLRVQKRLVRASAASRSAPGKRCSMRPKARWDPMPGMANPSSVAAGALKAPTPATPRIIAHTAMTYRRRLKAVRPSR
ncbi:hypothetical protein [Actinomadura algeriensis]|uniref:Uncharacterized protein n=1 Tax=Actinomadura algeriensis TaxID=1679523 RepID=A0ABR9K1S4_9ACTN|nr:hypothetical protein [Actinomadura algeriensis]MBE1536787.1 hypothetical protein [Actinomadura algeriensis]